MFSSRYGLHHVYENELEKSFDEIHCLLYEEEK